MKRDPYKHKEKYQAWKEKIDDAGFMELRFGHLLSELAFLPIIFRISDAFMFGTSLSISSFIK